jgi:hypothetical protein
MSLALFRMIVKGVMADQAIRRHRAFQTDGLILYVQLFSRSAQNSPLDRPHSDFSLQKSSYIRRLAHYGGHSHGYEWQTT